MSETLSRVYELGYLLVPTTPEGEVDAKVDALKGVITSAEGNVVADGAPEYIDLAYTMEKTVASKKSKYSQGYFGWMKFEAAPDALETIKKSLDANTDLIRYLLVKTSAENTIIFKKPKIEAKRGQSVDEEEMLDEDMAEEDESLDHEKLPDLQSDIDADIDSVDTGLEAEEEEKESE